MASAENTMPYDCWRLILNFLREDLANEAKNSSFYYYHPVDPLDIFLLILRSTSRNIQRSIEKYQQENALIFGFNKGAVTFYLSEKGYLSCLKYFVKDLKYDVGQSAADQAAERGHYECLKFIGEVTKVSWAYDSAQKAAKSGNYDCLVYCHQRGAHLSLPDLQNAGASGNLEMVKYIRPHVTDAKYANSYTSNAASNGHLHILKYAVESGDGLDENVCQRALEGDHYECLVYAFQNGAPKITEKLILEALRLSAIKCAMYLIEKIRLDGFEPFNQTYNGYRHVTIDLLKLLHKQGATWGKSTCTIAISSGSLDCLRFVLETGAPKTDFGLYCLVIKKTYLDREDWLEYFKVLEEHGVPHETYEYTDCSYYGNLECMKYLHETIKLPWHDGLSYYLVLHRNIKCLEYAHEHGCPWEENTCITAAERVDQDPKFLKYAHEHGAPWDSRVTFMAASRGHLDILKYAHEHGCEWSQKTIREADFRGHKKCVEYMQREGLKLVNTYEWDE